jgi:hypothetical protein
VINVYIRSIDTGGNGKCPKYEAGAMCAIRKDFIALINELDTTKPRTCKNNVRYVS